MIIMLNDCFWLNTIMTFLLKEIGITLERGTYKILNEELFRYDVPDYGDLPVRRSFSLYKFGYYILSRFKENNDADC
ncbi:hypothetical protein ABIE66_002925 [Peribacillus sp. B2I2]